MYPPIWGNVYWKVIHFTCFSFPNEPTESDKNTLKVFLETIVDLLPCPGCRKHAKTYITNNKPNLNSRLPILFWSFDFHNDVNKRTGKRVLSHDECIKKMLDIDLQSVFLNDQKRIEDHKDMKTLISKHTKTLVVINSVYIIALIILLCIIIWYITELKRIKKN